MASRVSIAVRQREAVERLGVAFAELAALWGVEAADLAPHSKDPELERVMQLEAIAGQAAAFVAAMRATPAETETAMAPESEPAESGLPVVRATRRRAVTA